jgi:hypothetical protein
MECEKCGLVHASRFLHDLTGNTNSREGNAMGSPVGVFSNEEVKGLTDDDIALLKRHVVQLIQTSPEIRDIIYADPKLVTAHDPIREILRTKARALLDRLKK